MLIRESSKIEGVGLVGRRRAGVQRESVVWRSRGCCGVGSVCGGMVLGCGIWGREENKNYFNFGSIGYLG